MSWRGLGDEADLAQAAALRGGHSLRHALVTHRLVTADVELGLGLRCGGGRQASCEVGIFHALAALYHERWDVQAIFDELKGDLLQNRRVFRSKGRRNKRVVKRRNSPDASHDRKAPRHVPMDCSVVILDAMPLAVRKRRKLA